MSFLVTFFAVVSLACFGTVFGSPSTDCPTPTAPENGEYIFYQGGMTVKYSCNSGYRLVGNAFAACQNSEWSSEAPQCLLNNVAIGDPVASYDYTCYQADERGTATLIRAPSIPHTHSPTYRRVKNPRDSDKDYLSAVYRCKEGYRMRNPGQNTLHCSQRSWVGERPVCDLTVELKSFTIDLATNPDLLFTRKIFLLTGQFQLSWLVDGVVFQVH